METGIRPNEEKWFDRAGWLVSILVSFVFVKIQVPLGLHHDFSLWGTLLGLLGFLFMYLAVSARHLKATWRQWTLALIFALIGLYADDRYHTALTLPENRTPSPAVEWYELLLFSTSCFFLMGVMAFLYKKIGIVLLKRMF